jgi:hypothetical protein
MDMNDVDLSLHEIEQMVLVAVKARESLMGSDTAPGFFQLRCGGCRADLTRDCLQHQR